VCVLDVRRINGLAEELCEVAWTDVGPQVTLVGHGVALIQSDIEFTGRADAHHHHTHLAGGAEVPAGMAFLAAGVTEVHAATSK